MKLQLDGTRIRLRLSEAELAILVGDGRLEEAWACADGSTARCLLGLDPAATTGSCCGNLMDLRIALPRADFLAFAAERPRRDGFGFGAGQQAVTVEVDVRDSHRRRREAAVAASGGI